MGTFPKGILMLKRTIKTFLVSQVLLAFVLLALEGINIPDSLEVRMVTPALVGVQVGYQDDSGKVVYDRERPYSAFGEMGVTRVVLSTNHSLPEMAWGFKNGPCQIRVDSVLIKKWLLIPFEITADTLTTYYKPTDGMSVNAADKRSVTIDLKSDNGSFVPDKTKSLPMRLCITSDFLIACIAFEVFLLLISLMMAYVKVTEEKVAFKTFMVQMISISLLLSLFFCVVLPVQSYLVNQMSWPFTCRELIAECVRNFAVSLCLSAALFSVLKVGFARLPLALAWGCVFYFYLETGILSLGLHTLNGDIRDFVANTLRGRLDALVFLLIVAVVTVAYKWIKRYIHYMAIGLAIMMLASLFDVRVEEKISNDDAVVKNFCSSEELIDSAVYSSQDNKLVFILDTVTTEVVTDILNEDDGLREAFQGFIAYTNNIGMHQMTVVGIPGLMRGKYLDKSATMRSYECSALSKDSFLDSYIENEIPTFFTLGLTRTYNWSSEIARKEIRSLSKDSSHESPLERRIAGLQAWNLREVIRFRLTPFMLKFQVLMMTFKDWPLYEKGAVEFSLFPKLAKLPVRKDVKQTLHVYHTAGAHPPYLTDRFGRKLSSPGVGYEGYREKAYSVLMSLAELFKGLQARGLYDNSLIVVTADHGGNDSRKGDVPCDGGVIPGAYPYPVLMVKPKNSTGPMTPNDTPTSHSKIASLMTTACMNSLNRQDVTNILHEDNRLYRSFVVHEDVHLDYVFQPDGTVTCKKINEGNK